jgi:hypothetical protein
MSARLQKLNPFSFTFSRRGINPANFGQNYKQLFVVKRISIRGIGDGELVCVLKHEFDKLPREEKKQFS